MELAEIEQKCKWCGCLREFQRNLKKEITKRSRILRTEMTFIQRGNYWRVHEEDQQHSFQQSAAIDIRGFPYILVIRKHAEITKFRTWLSL
jgi:hypothetical protein